MFLCNSSQLRYFCKIHANYPTAIACARSVLLFYRKYVLLLLDLGNTRMYNAYTLYILFASQVLSCFELLSILLRISLARNWNRWKFVGAVNSRG